MFDLRKLFSSNKKLAPGIYVYHTRFLILTLSPSPPPPPSLSRGREQKALPDRQVCELVDHYYGGWKQTEGYKTLKESIRWVGVFLPSFMFLCF